MMRIVRPVGSPCLTRCAAVASVRYVSSDASSRVLSPAETSALGFWKSQRDATLRDLATNTRDRSNVGAVDEGIVPLVAALNARDEFYTQSSCSGRAIVFHRLTGAGAKKKRGFGRGNVFSSHDPVADCRSVSEQVWTALTTQRGDGEVNHDLTHGVVELKFEPVMLHVACRNVDAAQHLLEAATGSGLRASGVIAMPRVKVNLHHPGEKLPLASHPSNPPASRSGDESTAAHATSTHGETGNLDHLGIPRWASEVDLLPPDMKETKRHGTRRTKVSMRMMTVSIAGKFGFAAPLAIDGEVLVGSARALEVMLRQANAQFVENEARKARLLDAVLERRGDASRN